MKKLLALALAVVLALSVFAGCAAGGKKAELALITDIGTIDDKSFNQGAWEGLVKYAEEKGISHQYYQPTEKSTTAYLESIDQAVKNGAKVIVTPGFLFEEPIYIAQDIYPEVNFILLDGEPHSADYADYRTEKNVMPILYAEQEAGFLAGYAVVKAGYTKLGFMGGMAVPAVIRYGYGFVQGAEKAAEELGISEITMNYHYTGGFDATPEAQTLAASWYNDGVEVIFGCGGAVGNSVMAAAEAAGKFVVGVDVDQSSESETVITSAMKGLSASVEAAIASIYAGEFKGGETAVFSAANNGVQLPMETSKLNDFDQAAYDELFAKIVSGEYVINADSCMECGTCAANCPVGAISVD